MSEKTQVKDEITSLHEESFEGGLQEKNHHSEGNEHEVATTKESTEEDSKEIITTKEETTEENEEKNYEEIRPSVENQTKPENGITEDAKKDDDMKSEETTKKAESEGLKVLDSMAPSKKEIASEDEDREKEENDQSNGDEVTSSKDATSADIKETTTSQHATPAASFKEQDLNEADDKLVDAQEASEQSEDQESEQKLEMSEKNQVEDEVTSLHNEMFEGGLQEKNHDSEGNEHDVATTKESIEEDTEEIITTKEETTEEKNDEEAIKCDDGQTKKSKSPLVEVGKEIVQEKANEYEEVIIHSDSSSMVLNEDEIVRKDEYKENEQEFYVSEKGQSGGDDVTSSQNVSSEDIKEMVGQQATEVAYFEEVQGLNAMAKDVIKEDEKDRTTIPQEASEQYENGVNDKSEQKPEEVIHSCLEIEQKEHAKEIKPSVETEVKEEQEISTETETQVESQLEATKHDEKNKEEVIESDDGTECKTAGETQNISPENKDDTIANASKSTEEILQDDFYASHEQKNIDALEQEKSISGELQARVEKEPHEDLRGHQPEDSKSENPCTTEQDTLEEVEEKTTMKPESETNNKIEVKLDAENQDEGKEERCEMKDEVVRTEKMSSELEQPMEQNVEEINAYRTTTMSEKTEDEIAEKNEDLSLGNIDDTEDYTIKEEKSFLDERTREFESSALEHEPVEEKTVIKPEEINVQAFQESESETTMEIEGKLDAENQAADVKEDILEMKNEVVCTEKMSSELGQPMEQNVEEIRACQITTMIENIEDENAEKVEDLSLGSIDDTNGETIKEEKSFSDERTKEIEISTLEHEPIGEKTTIKPEEITKEAFQENQSKTNKEIEAKLETERSEVKDEVVLTEKVSSEIGQTIEQNVEEIQACQTTTTSEKVQDEIPEKVEDLSLGSIEDTNDNTIKEEKSFLDERTRELEISTLEHEPVGDKTTIIPEEITKQAFHESQNDAKEIEAKLEVENQVGERENKSEVKDETVLTEKVSSELGQPMEQNVEEIQACQTNLTSEKVEDEIPENVEDLSLGSVDDTNDKTIKEEKSFPDERTRDLEISTLEHEPIGEKTTINPEEIIIQAFHESQSETNKEIEGKLDAENQVVGKEDISEVKDEVVLTEKVSSELGQPMEQNVEEIRACQTTTMSEKVEDEIPEKVEDVSLGSVDDTDDKTIKEEKSFRDERTRELEISTLEHEPIREKTTINPEEIQGFDETKSETNKEIEAKLDAENQVDGREDRSEMKDEVLLTEKMSSELEQPMEQNIEEIQPCQTTTISEKIEDEIAEKVENLSLGNIENTNDNATTEEKRFSDGRTREVEISTLEHEPIEEKNSGLDEVSKQKYTDLNEATTTEDTPNSEKSKAESENLPIALDSVSEVENPIVVPKSEDLNVKEECLISATSISVDDERGTVTKEISSDEISHSDPIAFEIPEVVADSEGSIVKEECIVLATAEHTDEKNGKEQEIKTNVISSEEKKEQTTESKQVVEHPSVMCPDAVLIEENLEIYEELKPTSELMIDEDQVDETKPQPEQSDITSENNQTLESKLEHTSEKDLNRSRDIEEDVTLASENQINNTEDQNETTKNVILKENVVAEIEKEEGKTEVKGQDSEEDNCPKELEKTSTSNLKVSANESIPTENTEVAEVKASSTIGDVKDDSIDEASRSESVPILEDSKEIESIDTTLNDQDGMKLSEEIETIEQKGVLISQLKANEILEEEEEKEEVTDKEEKNDGLISEIQTPEEILKMEVKEELLEATTDSCETLKDGLSSEKLLDERKEIDAKEDTKIIASGEEKAVEDSYQDAVAEVTEISQTEEKLVSTVPREVLTSSTTEDQTNELVTETEKTKVEHSSISNTDRNLEEFTKTLSDDQSVEKYINEEGEGNFGVEIKEAKSGNEIVEDVIVNEVLLEVEKAEESKSIKDNINEEARSIPNQLTSATDEVSQVKSNSSPNELLEAKDSVEDVGELKLTTENLNLKTEESTVTKGPTEDLKQDVEMIEADANKEKETLDEPQSDEPAKTTADSISHGDMHKLEEEPTKVDEIVAEGKEVSAVLTENLLEASPEMIPVKHDPETITTTEKIEEEIKDKDETLVNMDFPTSTKEVPCVSNEKPEELQVSTLNTEIDEGKQDGAGDMLNKKREVVQPHEHISDIKSVDPPSDVEIREQEELMPSEDNALLSQNDEKVADFLIQPLVQREIIQDVDERLEEAPKIDDQKQENDLDYTAKSRSVDVVRDAEIPSIEQEHLDAKEATVEPINQINQSEEKKEDEKIQSDIPIEKVPKQSTTHKEIADEFLVMPVAKEEEESDKVKKAEPIGIQEETMAEGNLHEEETEKRTNLTEAKGDVTNCEATNTEAEIPTEYVKSSDVELKGDMNVPVPKCASTRNPEVRSAILEVLSGMDETADKTAEAHVAEKGVLKEDVQLATEKEPFNLPLTKERSMEIDAPVTPGTEATENVEISKEYVTDDLIKISQIQPELQKDEVSACVVDKQLQDKPYQNESMESKLLSGNIDASHEQGEPTAKSLNASGTEPQCSNEVVKEEKKISDEKDKSEPATVDILHESTQGNSQVAKNLIEERGSAPTKDTQVDKEETGDNGAKTDEEDEAEDDEDNQKMGSCSDAPVMVEASKDMEVKVHKKSHNILSGVGSKVKHSIAKVKKAITGKSSHPKPPSPKAAE